MKGKSSVSIGAVTARSHGGLRPANQNFAPKTAQVLNIRKTAGRVSTHGLKHLIGSKIETQSLARMATALARPALLTVARSTPLSFGAVLAAEWLFAQVVEPNGFPGFDNIAAGWRDPQAEFFSPGDYIGNPFDIGPNAPPPARALLDADDTVGFTIRYWGDFGANPYPNPVPGINWPTQPQWLPNPDAPPADLPLPAYKPLPNLAPQNKPRPRPRTRAARFRAGRNNLQIRINIRGSRSRVGSTTTVKTNVPNNRDRGDKASPANMFVYLALLTLANALGETKEWTDILANAAGYKRGEHSGPPQIQKGHETVAKMWWLFVDGGINNIDFDRLAVLAVENEIEDAVFGFFGKLGKVASRRLGLTVGVQAGPGVG